MRAAVSRRYGGPEVIRVEDVAAPSPEPDEVLVRVRASTVSTAQMALRRGRPYFARLLTGLRGPKEAIGGSELAGEIVDVGPDVTRFKVGDEIVGATGAGFGAHAELVAIPEDGALARTPTNGSAQEAVAVSEGGLTALPFLRDVAGLQAGQRILINGAAGGVGSAAVQLAKHIGAHVTAVCSARSATLVASLGADEVIDYAVEDFTRSSARYDVVFDAAGKSSFGRSRRVIKPGGIYMTTVIGLRILADMLWTSRFGDRRAVISFTGLRKPAQKAADLRFLAELMEAGKIRPVIDRTFSLEASAEAHRYVESGKKQGTVMLTVS